MGKIKLDKSYLIKSIAEFGFFSEQIPDCFNSKSYAINIEKLIKNAKPKSTEPTTLSIYKNSVARRVVSVPNPEAYASLLKVYNTNWNAIRGFANSENSLSPITYIYETYDDNIEIINSENLKEKNVFKSNFVDGIKKSIRHSIGYKYCLKLDIMNCYNSIYTHSITWAVCGKKNAKIMYNNKEIRSKDYKLADRLDKCTRYLKSNETNGIIVGPFTSRVFSEVILASIDKSLEREGFAFTRYVDDYKMFFRTEADAFMAIPKIEKILNEYNLALNISKTEVVEFPFQNVDNMKSTYENALKNGGVFLLLNEAGIFHKNGQKGAYKYALKMIQDLETSEDEICDVIPLLINIMLLDPKYGKYVLRHIKKNLNIIGKEKIQNIIVEELKNNIKNDLQQELLLFLYFVKELDLEVDGELIESIIVDGNDFARIIALDLWKNKKSSIIRNSFQASKINKSINTLFRELESCEYTGEHWLLLYESEMHSLNPNTNYSYPQKSEFFHKMFELGVSFYS